MTRQKGASLIDTIVGISLMLLVFVGISGAFQLSIELVSNNKARIGAAALAQEQMEYIRSLSYDSMGVSGGIPAGTVPQTETIPLNGVTYTRQTLIRYYDDPKDGSGGADTNGIVADSKELKVAVSWSSTNGTRTLVLASRASPVGIEQVVIGGTLSVQVNNAASLPVAGASVRIVNPGTVPPIDVTSLTDLTGKTAFIGAPQATGYEVVITKSGYNNDQTYGITAQLPNPNPGHLTVTNFLTTSQTFRIDLLADKTIRTYKALEELLWQDSFEDELKVASLTDVTVIGGEAVLTGPAPYPASGEIQSVYLGPSYISLWKEVSWTDDEPAGTDIRYQVYYPGGSGPEPIPDAVLAGNSAGFTGSPVDISGLPIAAYPSIRLRALLATSDPDATPSIQSWRIAYDNGPEPLGNIAFSMRGTKIIGTDGTGVSVFKYDEALTTDALGVLALADIEEDTYAITVNDGVTGYDIAESCQPQPRQLMPGSAMETKLYLAPNTGNSLVVDVRTGAGALIEDASVRLFRGAPSYDTTKDTGECGQTFFSGLSSGTVDLGNAYSIEVSATGYQVFSSLDAVDVSGQSRLSVTLNPL